MGERALHFSVARELNIISAGRVCAGTGFTFITGQRDYPESPSKPRENPEEGPEN